MASSGKVSVILPVYNNCEDVINAIKSIEAQTYKNWELIIVDDCSTDGTYDLVNEYITNNSQFEFKLITNKKNSGCYVAMNEGLLIASGEYIARIDSDDTYYENKLQVQVGILKNNKKLVATTCYHKRGKSIYRGGEVCLLYQKNIIDTIGYYDSVRFSADSEFLRRMRQVFGSRLHKHPHVLYFAKQRKNSLTSSPITGNFNVRSDYVNKFIKWHNDNKKQKNKLFIQYPLPVEQRPFPVNPVMLS